MSIVREVGGAVLRRAGRVAGRLREAAGQPVDVLESDTEYLVVADAPGATASDVGVVYRDGTLELLVDRFREPREGFEMRFPGRPLAMDTSVEVDGVDADAARAELNDDGTLYVFLPKTDTDAGDEDADSE
ncbi:MAG: Hsp20/alpha crystallin family protein [Halobacteriaceae archaeon]